MSLPSSIKEMSVAEVLDTAQSVIERCVIKVNGEEWVQAFRNAEKEIERVKSEKVKRADV